MGLAHRLAALHFPRILEERGLRAILHQNKGVVLMYHEVLPDSICPPIWTVVPESRFISQIDFVQKNFDVLTIDNALKRIYETGDRSEYARPFAVVTFDDGYYGNLSCALPIMESWGLPFTVYVATSVIEYGDIHWYDKVIIHLLTTGQKGWRFDTSNGAITYSAANLGVSRQWARINTVLTSFKNLPQQERETLANTLPERESPSVLRMLSCTELSQMAESSFVEIGCHTHGHELLDQLTTDEARASIVKALTYLNKWTGYKPRHFSYPNGNYNESVSDLVQELGFSSAVTVKSRHWSFSDSRFAIPRIGVGRFDTMSLFRAKLSGLLQETA